jgi:hypothetical protein
MYAEDICKEVIRGLHDQMKIDGRLQDTGVGCVFAMEEGETEWVFYDDVTGETLDWEGVIKAREEEIEEFCKHGVYHKVPITKCYEATGKAPIGVRWIDINKGDKGTPEYRSRLVAKEIKRDSRTDLFAATPRLEAKKLLFSMAVTKGVGYIHDKKKGMKIDFIDIRRAYFHAKARRQVFVKLPPEDDEEGMCGELGKSMYGTRDASQNWEEEYGSTMLKLGFTKGLASPCVFYHEKRNLRVVVHGDDFTILGWANDLDWFKERITDKYEIKHRGRLGPGDSDDKQIRILNRVVWWNHEGIHYEPDQRHAEIMVKMMGVRDKSSVVTPGVKPCDDKEEDGDDEQVEESKVTRYRAVVARGNYLSQDRLDIKYAIKELCRWMGKPRNKDWRKLIRLTKYLVGRERYINEYKYQDEVGKLDVWTDTDYAGCRETRKSTSGGLIMLGTHLIRGWSATQRVIALSSGEAE